MSSTATLSIGLSSYVILISEILLCSLMIVYLFFLNFLPTLLSITFFLLLFLLIYRSSRKKVSTLGQLNLNYSGLINKQYIHAFGLIKTIKIFNLEKVMSNFLLSLALLLDLQLISKAVMAMIDSAIFFMKMEFKMNSKITI
jgi:ABC-type multidrug transport system fused ATPase/permease subunit